MAVQNDKNTSELEHLGDHAFVLRWRGYRPEILAKGWGVVGAVIVTIFVIAIIAALGGLGASHIHIS
jgi:hypothetical protein